MRAPDNRDTMRIARRGALLLDDAHGVGTVDDVILALIKNGGNPPKRETVQRYLSAAAQRGFATSYPGDAVAGRGRKTRVNPVYLLVTRHG
jgi:hypothetical protein